MTLNQIERTNKRKTRRRRIDYNITCYPSESSQLDMYYVYIDRQYTTACLSKADARRKVFNHITFYRHCEIERPVINVMKRTKYNHHNFIG